MKIYAHHRWDVDYAQAVALQNELRRKIRLRPLSLRKVRFVAGADVAIDKANQRLCTAVVVLAFPSLEVVESRTAITRLAFPYIPGLLSFREIPGLIRCFSKVTSPVDVIICDGQGIAHPRGFGLASHLGVILRRPTVGCAKSRLVGEFGSVPESRGASVPLLFQGRRVGSVVRSRDGVRPLFVSPGHLVDHASARRMVLACAPRYRIPEPTRLADRLAGEEKRRGLLGPADTD